MTTMDTARDQEQSDVRMTSWDGTRTVQLTSSPESEHGARWSPDGRWLAFLSGRGDPRDAQQLWLLDRFGGEAALVTGYPGGVSDYDWAPDSRRLVLVVKDPPAEPAESDSAKRTRPIVIDRFKFKEDELGYLSTSAIISICSIWRRGAVCSSSPAPSTRPCRPGLPTARPSHSPASVAPIRTGATTGTSSPSRQRPARPSAADNVEGSDGDPYYDSRPAWSPDGKWIAYLRGGAPKLIYYGVERLAVVSANGGAEPVVFPDLDRWVSEPRWSEDGKNIFFLLEDDRNYHLARVPTRRGPGRADRVRVAGGERARHGPRRPNGGAFQHARCSA